MTRDIHFDIKLLTQSVISHRRELLQANNTVVNSLKWQSRWSSIEKLVLYRVNYELSSALISSYHYIKQRETYREQSEV